MMEQGMMLKQQLAAAHIERRRRFEAVAYDPEVRPVERAFLKTVIDRLAKEADRKRLAELPEIVRIQVIVARAFGATRAEIIGRSRLKDIMLPRHVAIWLAHEITGFSFPHIGRRFGGRDHTTALHAVRKISAMIEADPLFAAHVEGLRAQIEKTGAPS